MLQARLDGLGKVGWLAILVLAFWTAWPLGLLALAYLADSGRLRTWWAAEAPGTWFNLRGAASGAGWQGWGMSSGNRAFDDYRVETLRRLEQEQREFKAFLDRLRRARDESEFDQFMAERRNRPADRPSASDPGRPATQA